MTLERFQHQPMVSTNGPERWKGRSMSDFTHTGDTYSSDQYLDDTDAGRVTPSAEPSEPSGPVGSHGLISSASAPSGDRMSEVWAESAETSTEENEPDAAPMGATPNIELSDSEARVLGSLIEKSFLTPDIYPMTTNAIATACNQKTNRDPVVDYSPVLIDSTLLELRQRNLVRRVHSSGSRSTKHRQTLDEALSLTERQLALLSVLLLRGPQTIGELRLRTERHDVGFDNLDVVDTCLEALASRLTPLVRQLQRQPGHKENRWQHLLGDPASTDLAPAKSDTESISPTSMDSERAPSSPALVERVDLLENELATVRRQLASLADKLGEPLE